MPRGAWGRPETQAELPFAASGHSSRSASVSSRVPAKAGHQRDPLREAHRCCSGGRCGPGGAALLPLL
eukprot:8501734-Alexandrium_andersonii.AAC.1